MEWTWWKYVVVDFGVSQNKSVSNQDLTGHHTRLGIPGTWWIFIIYMKHLPHVPICWILDDIRHIPSHTQNLVVWPWFCRLASKAAVPRLRLRGQPPTLAKCSHWSHVAWRAINGMICTRNVDCLNVCSVCQWDVNIFWDSHEIAGWCFEVYSDWYDANWLLFVVWFEIANQIDTPKPHHLILAVRPV